jgi:DNA-binding IclR family transcriptional regulator
MLYIEACSSDTLLTLRMGRGVRMPIMSTSIGRAFLAALPEKEREYLVASLKQKNEPVVGPKELEALAREIKRYEEDGICLSVGEWNADVNAAATPIRWRGDSELIVLSISGPSFIITEDLLMETLIPRLKQLAQHISKHLSSFGSF